MTILDNGKILIYDFFYNCLKTKYRPKRELIYTDTDSFLLDMDIAEDIDLYDKSNYPKDHMLYSDRNKKVLRARWKMSAREGQLRKQWL